LDVAELKAETAEAVAKAVASVEGQDAAVLITYRNDKEYEAAEPRGRWTASWHRQVCARAAQQAAARIDYAEDEDDSGEEE
jgi:predicted nucleic acid-binding protein